MDSLDKKIIVDKFLATVNYDLKDIKLLVSFLRIEDEKQIQMIDTAIKLFETKIKKAKKAKSEKELNKYIKVKKIIKNKIIKVNDDE